MNFMRQIKNFKKVSNLCGMQSKFSLRSYSTYGRSEATASSLLKPLGGQHYIVKRHQLVKIRFKEEPSSKKYGALWALEQSTNVVLVFLIPAAFLMKNKEVDMAMGAVMILHSYWGMHSIIVDYLRPENVGKLVPTAANVMLIIVSLLALTGIYQLVYDDIGIAMTVKKFWQLKGNDAKPKEVYHQERKWYQLKKKD